MAGLIESVHFSRPAWCIKVEVDINIWNIYCLNMNSLWGHKIWHEPREISKISLENKARGWTKFKNFFARLTRITKLIFRLSKLFGSGQFLVNFLRSHGSKIDRSQKTYLNEKSVFSWPSTSQRNFWISFILWLYFHVWFLKLYEARAKFCDLGGHSYLDKKCSQSLCLPPLWCTKLGVRSASTLLHISLLLYNPPRTYTLG